MINYLTSHEGIPSELYMRAYLRTIRDKMDLLYDSVYSEPERFESITDVGTTGYHICPDSFREGLNLFDYLTHIEDHILYGSQISWGYLTNLVHFSTIYDKVENDIVLPFFEFPEGGTPVTLENFGEVASERFPTLHLSHAGYDFPPDPPVRYPPYGFLDMARHFLPGPIPTFSNLQMFYYLEMLLNSSNCHVLKGSGIDSKYCQVHDEVGNFRRTKMYMTYESQQYEDGELTSEQGSYIEESEGRTNSDTSSGIMGWKEKYVGRDENGEAIYEEYECRFRISLTIHSSVSFRYKYAVIAAVQFSNEYGFQESPYPFECSEGSLIGTNVIHEQQQWVEGDQSVTFEFSPGSFQGKIWHANLYAFRIVIYPDLPDRLSEVLEEYGII